MRYCTRDAGRTDNELVTVLACCAETFATLSRAAAKAAKSRLRNLGLSRVAPEWPTRAQICERCPLRVIRAGTSYCGQPFIEKINRDETIDGCGCPTRAKARDPHEHCPLDLRNRPALRTGPRCNCKWCKLDRRVARVGTHHCPSP